MLKTYVMDTFSKFNLSDKAKMLSTMLNHTSLAGELKVYLSIASVMALFPPQGNDY